MVIGNNNYDSVGVPVANTEMKVMDVERRSDLAQGQMGEICIRVPQVSTRSSRFIGEPQGPICINRIISFLRHEPVATIGFLLPK
jgi:hypothetical protein